MALGDDIGSWLPCCVFSTGKDWETSLWQCQSYFFPLNTGKVRPQRQSQPCAKPGLKHEWASWMSRQGRLMIRVLVWGSKLHPERKFTLMSWVELRQDRVDPVPRPHGQDTQLSAGSPICHVLALPEDTCLGPRHRGKPDTGMDCFIKDSISAASTCSNFGI